MTALTARTPATAAPWPARDLAYHLRTAARSMNPEHALLLQRAADVVEAAGVRVDDVEELDALTLDTERPVDHVTLLDRLGNVLVAHPDRQAEQVTVVRHPSLREARTAADDWPRPLAFPSSDLEQCRFPMLVLGAPGAFLLPEWQPPGTSLAP